MSTAVLDSLREMIATKGGYRPRSSLSFSMLEEGIPKGALTEISGPGKTEFLVRFLSEHPSLKVAWMEDRMSIYPYALFQKNARLQRILFAEAGTSSPWALMQILRSQVFQIIVFSSTTLPLGPIGEPLPRHESRQGMRGETGRESCGALRGLDEKKYRAMQLSAEKSQAAMIFLRDEASSGPQGSWPFSLQIEVEQENLRGLKEIRVLKRRY